MQGAASLAEPRGAAFMSRRPGWMALLTMQLLFSLPSSYKELQSIHCFTLDLNGIISLIGHPCLLWGKYVSLGKMTQQLGLRKDLVMQPRLEHLLPQPLQCCNYSCSPTCLELQCFVQVSHQKVFVPRH